MTSSNGNGWRTAALSALGALLLLGLTLRVQELSTARRALVDEVQALRADVTALKEWRKSIEAKQ